jgi:hypothetical protein
VLPVLLTVWLSYEKARTQRAESRRGKAPLDQYISRYSYFYICVSLDNAVTVHHPDHSLLCELLKVAGHSNVQYPMILKESKPYIYLF